MTVIQQNRFPEKLIAGTGTSAVILASTTYPSAIGELALENDTFVFRIAKSLSAGDFIAIGQTMPYVAKTANYTLTAYDYLVNATANSFDLTLPTAVGCTGRQYVLKNSGTGIITVKTTSSQTIDNNASGVLTLVQWDSLVVMSTGSDWIRI